MKRLSQMLVFACVLVITSTTVAEAASYQVIVNSKNQSSSISKKDLSRIYLKRKSKWENGRSVEVVDQKNNSQVHADFVQDVLGRDPDWVENHWQKMVFSGRSSAPTVKKSDVEVLAYVRANEGAFGYVSGDVEVGNGVKVLAVK